MIWILHFKTPRKAAKPLHWTKNGSYVQTSQDSFAFERGCSESGGATREEGQLKDQEDKVPGTLNSTLQDMQIYQIPTIVFSSGKVARVEEAVQELKSKAAGQVTDMEMYQSHLFCQFFSQEKAAKMLNLQIESAVLDAEW